LGKTAAQSLSLFDHPFAKHGPTTVSLVCVASKLLGASPTVGAVCDSLCVLTEFQSLDEICHEFPDGLTVSPPYDGIRGAIFLVRIHLNACSQVAPVSLLDN
jgi:hypothetical protein